MDTFEITYQITVDESESIEEKTESICLEQSVELPRQILPGFISETIVGEFVEKRQIDTGRFEVVIAWPLENADDISQFLNILYGNISLQPGIRITGAVWTKLAGKIFKGSRYGISRLRTDFGVHNRSLGATALKPLGSSVDELAESCYKFALGGIDIIKDDHGLTNQKYAPYAERVRACVEAVRKAEQESGRRSRYFPNITAFAEDSIDRYHLAAEQGADGVLLCPHISGLETMHRLARLDTGLPIIAHPAFSGSLTQDPRQGLSPDFLYGQLWRALGADFVIYPNTGGRFSFTPSECEAINRSARSEDSPFHSSFPMPAGGMQLDNLTGWKKTYGADTVFLIGGDLYEHPAGREAAAGEFRQTLTE